MSEVVALPSGQIPVSTGEAMLLPEENTLAIMKWRLLQMSPFDRWYPVLERYISYIAARVDGLAADLKASSPHQTASRSKTTLKRLSTNTLAKYAKWPSIALVSSKDLYWTIVVASTFSRHENVELKKSSFELAENVYYCLYMLKVGMNIEFANWLSGVDCLV